MAKILFVWELGKGFGHLTRYLDLVNGLKARGHEVIYATRDVGNTEKVFGRSDITILQAPIMMHSIGNPYKVQHNLSHLIHNTGFGEIASLRGLVKSWHYLYDHVRPDLSIFDHSPTALLAARGYPWKRIVSGSGFMIPPPGAPLPAMRYWQRYDESRLAEEEGRLLATMNQVLADSGAAPLASVSELYDADGMLLFGFEELDHYPQRRNGNYLGLFTPPNHGVPPQWPEGLERRVFAYLHPYRKIGELFHLLSIGNFATIIYAPEVPERMKRKFANERLTFSNEPLALSAVAADCNLAITNGTPATTTAFLMQGKPVLCIPTTLERVMVTRRVVDLGAGLGVHQKQPENLKGSLRKLFTEDRFARAAKAFRDKYQHLNLNWQTQQMFEIVERLVSDESAAPAEETDAPRSERVHTPETG